MKDKKVTPRLLGWGMAEKSRRILASQKDRTDQLLDEITGSKKKSKDDKNKK